MKIEYKTKKLERVCTNYSEAEKEHGSEMAEKIHQRIVEMDAVSSVETMLEFGICRCHQLKGKRKNQYAVELIHPFYLVFEEQEQEIQITNIMEMPD